MTTMLYRSFLFVMAGIAFLLGVQAPNFVDQYGKRLDAHLREASVNLSGYQEIANRFFDGSLSALLAKHEQSSDEVFRAEAKPLRQLFERHEHFANEQRALATTLPKQILFITTRADRQLLRETWDDYTFTIPLNATAITTGLFIMTVVILMIGLMRVALRRVIAGSHRPKAELNL